MFPRVVLARTRPDSSLWALRGLSCVVLPMCLFISAGCSSVGNEKSEVSAPTEAERAINLLREEARSNPGDARIQYELGNQLYDVQRYSEAIEAYAAAIEVDPDLADAYTNLGLSHRQLNDIPRAVEYYRRSLVLQPDDIGTLKNLIIALRARGAEATAVNYLARLVELQPGDQGARSDLASNLYSLRRYADSAVHYTVLVKEAPTDLSYRFNLGSCFFSLESWERAIETWVEVIEMDENYERAQRGMAVAYWHLKDYDAAWVSVGECQRLGVALPPEFVARLRAESGRLGPN